MYIYYLSFLIFFLKSIIIFYFSLLLLILKLNIFLEWNFMFVNSMMFNMYIYIDWMTMMFIFTVMFISSMIMLYSTEYMSHDNNNTRFYWTLLMFIFSMMFMIISPNIFSILIGWDGLGLTSYCLIIYYQSNSSYNSGMLTFMINRLGDVLIILSISLMITMGSVNMMNYNFLSFNIMLYLMIASFTKSAQFPFSAWLPAAMAAPTPVSSLVHSSTLVTAGIYMMIRFNFLMNNFNNLMFLMIIFGLITMFMAGISANFEFDLKKIIAYSTLSQLGLMMMILGMNKYMYAFFHLIIHAMFKSMMFMCSGIVIHYMMNYQDIRYMGWLKNFMPMTASILLISNFSLCGLPFYSGFFSKDLILETMFMSKINLFIYILLLISTMLTVMYSFRLFYFLMYNKFMYNVIFNIYENKKMSISMILLMMMSLMFGSSLNWILFNNIEIIFLLNYEKVSIILICLIGFMSMMMMFNNKILNKNFTYKFQFFFNKMWFLTNFNYMINIKLLKFSKIYSLSYDKGWSEELFKNTIFNLNKSMNWFSMLNFNNLINLMIYIMLMNMLIMFLF